MGERRRISSLSCKWRHWTPPEKPSLPSFTDTLPISRKPALFASIVPGSVITVLATFFSSGARVAQPEKKAGTRKIRRKERKEDRGNLPEFFNFGQAGATEPAGCKSAQDILYPPHATS